ncbi:protease pro-enzyme activation domain-containing protein, partial [Jatrophihabitans endophyticus]|uniref:S53 family peptidase n=1 Tax=Jatrophihabitans endophyticus TaxID=1206085 RepID=UPI001A0F18A4
MSDARTTLAGSLRAAAPSSDVGEALAPDAPVQATLVLRRRAEPPAEAFTGPALSPAELAERYGADPEELAGVVRAVSDAGLEVVRSDAASRRVRVRGRSEAMSALFGTTLRAAAGGAAGSRRREGELSLGPDLAGPLVAVLGLDDRPQADVRFRRAARADATGFTPLQLATAYDFPAGTGAGRTIALIELGGGFGQDDLDTYFGGLGLASPTVTAVPVDGATNQAGQDPDGADGEVLLDIEVAGAVAPQADVLVYFAPNTDDGFVDAISDAAHASPAPTAISISWGQSEDQWTAQGRSAMDAAIADAVLVGATVTVAAGDSGSSDAAAGSTPHVDFPASSPHALACGGTSLTLDASGAVASETVWNDGGQGGSTGGGVSDEFATPDWQANAGVPPRDVSGGKAGR